MSEFTPQEDSVVVWQEALHELHTNKQYPRLLGERITTVPPKSTDPEKIILHYEYDGNHRDVYRTLTLTPEGAESLRVEEMHWGPGVVPGEDAGDYDETYGPEDTPTIDYLGRLARKLAEQNNS